MSEHTHQHHSSGSGSHHHHHHKLDGASKFKRKSLLAIERRKKMTKWVWRFLCALAVVLAITVVVIYLLD